MRRTLPIGILVVAGIATAGLALAPAASAYPVGPWGVEGPCVGVAPSECAIAPSEDGLTWSFHGDSWNYDKYGNFLCMSSTFWCDPLMVVVRHLDPMPIGEWLGAAS